MEKTLNELKRHNIHINENDPNFISVAMELTKLDRNKFAHWFYTIAVLILGISFVGMLIAMFFITIDQWKQASSLGDYLFISIFVPIFCLFVAICAYILIGLGLYGMTVKPEWYIIMYKDRLAYYNYDFSKKKFNEITIPIQSIQRGILLKMERRTRLYVKASYKGTSVYHLVSVHIEYTKDHTDECDILHLTLPYEFAPLDRALNYLKDDKQIPFFYVYADHRTSTKMYEKEERLIKHLDHEPYTESIDLKKIEGKERLIP